MIDHSLFRTDFLNNVVLTEICASAIVNAVSRDIVFDSPAGNSNQPIADIATPGKQWTTLTRGQNKAAVWTAQFNTANDAVVKEVRMKVLGRAKQVTVTVGEGDSSESIVS
jgi:hypothetical protein